MTHRLRSGRGSVGARRRRGDGITVHRIHDAERVRAELEVLGLDASRHLVSFFEPLLADLGVVRSRDLHGVARTSA